MHRQKQKKQLAETNSSSSMATQDKITRVATVLAKFKERRRR